MVAVGIGEGGEAFGAGIGDVGIDRLLPAGDGQVQGGIEVVDAQSDHGIDSRRDVVEPVQAEDDVTPHVQHLPVPVSSTGPDPEDALVPVDGAIEVGHLDEHGVHPGDLHAATIRHHNGATEKGSTIEDAHRAVRIERIELGRYRVENDRGGTIDVGAGADFTAVELLLAAIGCCTAADVDHITHRRSAPDRFVVTVTGTKVRDPEAGNRMEDLEVRFDVQFPPGTDGDEARRVLPVAMTRSHDRLCTVSRTVELESPIAVNP